MRHFLMKLPEGPEEVLPIALNLEVSGSNIFCEKCNSKRDIVCGQCDQKKIAKCLIKVAQK